MTTTTPALSEPMPFDNEAHVQRVAAVQSALRARAGSKGEMYVDKGGEHHFVPRPGDKRFSGHRVDLKALSNVLHLDVPNRRAWAEPGVTFAQIVRETLPLGLAPKTVPELEGITLGGAVAGASVESMSFRHGGFHDGCFAYEMLTTRGERIVLQRGVDGAMFDAPHASYGTLGIVTGIGFELVPAQPFVKLEYRRYLSYREVVSAMRTLVEEGSFDFIDGIAHGPTEYILCLGTFVERAPYTSSYRAELVYYKSTRTRTEDYLSTFDYFFRYDTECHWLTRTVPLLEWPSVRRLVGSYFLGSTNLIRWTKRLEKLFALMRRPDVVVDVFIPHRQMNEFLAWYETTFNYWPLWLVPYKMPTPYHWISAAHAAKMKDTLFVDCAVYGMRNLRPDVDYSQLLEEKTYALDGVKTLISQNHHTRERFWEILNKPAYDAAKQKLDPDGMQPNVYDKFHR